MKEFAGAPGYLGIWGEWLFIFRELESTGNYFRGAREQAHNFGDIGSLAKKDTMMQTYMHEGVWFRKKFFDKMTAMRT